MVQQLAKLVMYFSLILILLEFFLNFTLKHLEKLWLEQHLFNRNEYLNDHLEDFALRKLKPDTIWDDNFVIDKFITM